MMENKIFGWHILFWLLITGITFGVALVLLPVGKALLFTFTSFIFYALVFYTNTLVLFPKYYKATQNTRYIISIAVLLIVATYLMVVVEQLLIGPVEMSPRHMANPKMMMTARGFLWLLLMVVVGTVYLIQKRLKEQYLSHKEIQENKLKTELKLLRTQINPHFLFNALNNVFALSYMKSEKAPESILKLSSMLRYVIEDCTGDTIPIKSEIEYIENYIDFQKMKSPDDMKVLFTYDQLNKNIHIAPMLFIPFLENSFKYSKIEEFQNASITIEIKSDTSGKLVFYISNTVPPTAKARHGAGTGINNVKQRLGIIYPNKHQLIIDESASTYSITLTIETNESKLHSN